MSYTKDLPSFTGVLNFKSSAFGASPKISNGYITDPHSGSMLSAMPSCADKLVRQGLHFGSNDSVVRTRLQQDGNLDLFSVFSNLDSVQQFWGFDPGYDEVMFGSNQNLDKLRTFYDATIVDYREINGLKPQPASIKLANTLDAIADRKRLNLILGASSRVEKKVAALGTTFSSYYKFQGLAPKFISKPTDVIKKKRARGSSDLGASRFSKRARAV